ncbi:MAG: hypothetical protein ACKVW3_14355 [Phycisphaerales bacterium]
MPKDKRINELPGIAQSAVVGLNRIGILSLADLLAADFDRVAYIVENADEATRLMKEARRTLGTETPRRRHSEPTSRHRAHGSTTTHSTMPASLSHPAGPTQPAPPGQSALGAALALAGKGLEGRTALANRIGALSMLFDHGASDDELAAALVLEPAESGAVALDEIASTLGNDIARAVEEAAALRAVPMLPTGKLPRYYLDMARNATVTSRRICAAFVPSMLAADHGPQAYYAGLLLEGLEAGGPDDLVAAARAAASRLSRSAA